MESFTNISDNHEKSRNCVNCPRAKRNNHKQSLTRRKSDFDIGRATKIDMGVNVSRSLSADSVADCAYEPLSRVNLLVHRDQEDNDDDDDFKLLESSSDDDAIELNDLNHTTTANCCNDDDDGQQTSDNTIIMAESTNEHALQLNGSAVAAASDIKFSTLPRAKATTSSENSSVRRSCKATINLHTKEESKIVAAELENDDDALETLKNSLFHSTTLPKAARSRVSDSRHFRHSLRHSPRSIDSDGAEKCSSACNNTIIVASESTSGTSKC